MSAAATERASALRRGRAARVAGLYAVTPDAADTADLAARVDAAIAGGATAIQYRAKSAAPATRREQAEALARIAAARGALFIVNDDAALAAAVGADGVHIGEDDGGIEAARRLLGPDAIVGVSCYDDFALGEAAAAAGADYVAFGSFFPSTVKPGARRADIALLGRAAVLRVPVVAIGGIDEDNAGTLIAAGADALAVISAVFGAPDPGGVLRAARRIRAVADVAATARAARTPASNRQPLEN
jgi:thiamine-phosphate pyrophosphorylase